ncbi:Putative ubiquitin-protein ligase E3B/C [Septoria linicola]|uniref:HECT-type E3 ubiquitin transferase n=1 Tax=Septoria linicola TaxID=215465 RepID=A0A9Q9EJ02_9PEZI|nr:putative ubiquitin-protein ligase E3B/C [Septoria linicola]USW52545.1 Putative ubiquitin-protein ligase E3B/C [Septoria linicola]
MYQTFSGSARRRPQVNLSGRGTNPFAKANGTGGGGAQAAVASAQQDRANRALQRERVQASTRIQKTWRGRQARRRTFQLWRAVWDEQEDKADGPYATEDESLQQLRRLMLFYAPRSEVGDVNRLAWYGTRQITTSEHVSCTHTSWPTAYAKLIRACLSALRSKRTSEGDSARTIVGILAFAARQSQFDLQSATEYYEALTSVDSLPAEPLQAALLAPLQSKAAYAGLVVLLEHPQSTEMLSLLSTAVNVDVLSDAVAVAANARETTTRARLWLLGNVIYLAKHSKSMSFTSAVARLLGSLADDIDFESHPVELDNRAFDELLATTGAVRLNTFLHAQVAVLLDQNAIRNLLVGKRSVASDAQALAGYALTLLRCFPRQGDNIRMWLHLGPTHVDSMSPTRYLWEAAKQRQIFEQIRSNSRGVVSVLKNKAPSAGERDDWTIVLVFLEMFSFDLKIMDDEEFMGNSPVSKRNSAVPSADVALLVTFCKNLGFALYYDAAELNESKSAPLPQLFPSRFRSAETPVQEESKPTTVAGLPGLTFDYLRGLVTALLRAIYERDSRRKFLPKDHWLMTDRFDMSHFIGGVVEEEERRHMVQEQDDEDKDDDSDDDVDEAQNAFTNRASVIRAQERRQRQQRKASRQRYLQSVAPKLEILQNMPFIIPFHTRVETFRQFVYLDQEKRRHGTVDPDLWRHNMMFQPHANGRSPHEMLARHHAKIKRTQEFEDAFDQFYELGADLKEPIQITFVDQWDMPEAGIDGGGVTKEFLTSVINQAFDQKDDSEHTKYFVENEEHLLYPNPTAFEELKLAMKAYGYGENTPETRGVLRDYFKKYEFLGRIIGKCLYEGILVDVSFAGFFLKKWALTGGAGSSASDNHYRPNINDLRELDEGLYKGLLQVKNADNVEELGLTFSINDVITSRDARAPQTKVVEVDLIPNGSNTPVTNQNRLAYINAIASYRLKGQAQRQSRAFLRGLSDIIQPSWLSMFNQSELQTLIGGSGAGIDINDLRKNTLYGGTYVIGNDGLEHPSIQLFWKVFSTMADEDRRKVLKFVTSTPRGPLLGFSHLNPKFSIRDSGGDENRFPTTSTCVNLLKLPMYKSEKVLREKLLAAVNSGAGFDLS